MIDFKLQKICQASREAMMKFSGEYEWHFGSDLAGSCAISSYFLKTLAAEFGFYIDLAEGIAFEKPFPRTPINHCWNIYQNKFIIDLTATQFRTDLPPVHITEYPNKNYFEKFKGDPVLQNLKNWPEYQTPATYDLVYYFDMARNKLNESVDMFD